MRTYNNEKGIISLTSWKKRITTVGKTIFNLYNTCKGFHIVLVLSSNEFPKKEEELPNDLKVLLDKNVFELLWVEKNYKAYKKVLFTMLKYPNVPIISADDDCYYKVNYAENLYHAWIKNGKPNVVRYTPRKDIRTQGPCTLYNMSKYAQQIINSLTDEQIRRSLDDDTMSAFIKANNLKLVSTGIKVLPFIFHDDTEPLSKYQRDSKFYKNCFI